MSEDRSGYIYVLKAQKPFEEVYKIGRTTDPERRLRQFGVQLPYPVEVVVKWREPNCHKAERLLHEIHAEARVGGEWFRLQPKEVEWIKAIALYSEAIQLVRRVWLQMRAEHTAIDPNDVRSINRLYKQQIILGRAMRRFSRRYDLAAKLEAPPPSN